MNMISHGKKGEVKGGDSKELRCQNHQMDYKEEMKRVATILHMLRMSKDIIVNDAVVKIEYSIPW